mgnify:CR=1 FL=1
MEVCSIARRRGTGIVLGGPLPLSGSCDHSGIMGIAICGGNGGRLSSFVGAHGCRVAPKLTLFDAVPFNADGRGPQIRELEVNVAKSRSPKKVLQVGGCEAAPRSNRARRLDGSNPNSKGGANRKEGREPQKESLENER